MLGVHLFVMHYIASANMRKIMFPIVQQVLYSFWNTKMHKHGDNLIVSIRIRECRFFVWIASGYVSVSAR